MTHHENHRETWRSRQKLQSSLAALLLCLVLSPAAVAQSFTVPGNSGRNWVDTGLDLTPGTLIELYASGEVDVGAGGRFGPEGTMTFADVSGYPAETRYRYGLVARLTASHTDPNDDLREEWTYGERHQYCAERGGHLWLTVNDNDAGDNHGSFTVDIRRGACRSEPTT